MALVLALTSLLALPSGLAVADETSPSTLATVAGGPGRGAADNVSMEPVAVVTDGTRLYVADKTYGLVRVVDLQTWTVSVLTGSDTALLPWSGAVPVPSVADPCALALDPAGVLHIGDVATKRVYRVDADGSLTTVVGRTGSTIGTRADETALQRPCGLTFDAAGNLYVADSGTDIVSRVGVDGEVARVAGGSNRSDGKNGDGETATNAVLADPSDVAVDDSGAIFIATSDRIRRVAPDGVISTYAGNGSTGPASSDVGPATDTSLSPRRLTLTGDGGMFLVEGNRLRHIDAEGIITTLAGSSPFGGTGDGGAAADALLYAPADVTVDPELGIVVADTGTGRIRVIDAEGTIRSVAGLHRHPSRYGTTGYPERTRLGGDGAPAIDGQLHSPGALALTESGSLLIAETGNQRIRELAADGRLQTRAGGGCCWPYSDGPTSVPEIRTPEDVTAGPDGDIYVTDRNRIKRAAADGTVSIIAGTGYSGAGGADGDQAVDASLASAASVAVTDDGVVYIGQQSHVARVNADGTLTRYAGTGWGTGPVGDGGPARDATLSTSYRRDIAVDQFGNLYISDAGRIRKVNALGVITTIAGTGTSGYSGDGGPATAAQISVGELTVARDGSIYFSTVGNGTVIRRVLPTGIIQTVAGSGTPGFDADGTAATSARFTDVTGIAATADGTVYVSDVNAHRVRSFSATPSVAPVRPAPVAGLSVDARIGAAELDWNEAAAGVRAGVMIRKTPGGVAATTPMDGALLYDGPANAVTARGLTSGSGFTFTAFAYDAEGQFSPPVAVSAWSTSITAVPSRTRIEAGEGVTVRGRLQSLRGAGAPLAGRLVRIDVRRRGTTRWSELRSMRTTSTGRFAAPHRPSWSAEYRAVFAGRRAHLGSRSGVALVRRR